MRTQKSYAEFILGTFQALFKDCACRYPELTKEFNRDLLRLSSALDSHGPWFALEIMPAFRKHFDKCLSERRLTPSGLTHFGVLGKGSVLPRLLRGLTMRVFESDGVLKDQPDIECIRLIRQILGSVRKLRLDSDIKHRGDTVRDFYRTDFGARRGHLNWDDHDAFHDQVLSNTTSFVDVVPPDSGMDDLFEGRAPEHSASLRRVLETAQRVADLLTGTLGVFNPGHYAFKHGPGSVADQSFGSYKYDFKRWSDRLESQFPYADFAVANFSNVDHEMVEDIRSRGFAHEPPARLCAVPKTIKAPRLIACEPVGLQWCQQAVRDFLYERVRGTSISHFIDFRRQDKNGALALSASRDQKLATIDLSSASDRITCWHVERLFRRSPSLLQALQASRSVWLEQEICKKSPKYHYIRKFSTMGNATTFPVQSLFFLSLALASVLVTRGKSASFKTLKELGSRQVRVFGDDIIVPTDCSETLVGLLEALSLKVNTSKTFLKGNFRESCGVDAFCGHDVTSVSVLEMPRRASPSSIVSAVDTCNNLLNAGYYSMSEYIRKTASFAAFNKIREVKHGSGAFGWQVLGVPSHGSFKTRVNVHLQKLEVKCLQLVVDGTRRPAEGSPGLLQFFTEAAKKVTSAKSTLGYLDRRPKSRLTLRWADSNV